MPKNFTYAQTREAQELIAEAPGASKNQFYTKIYDLDYFTGSQMFLYIGDVWVDEITSLEYVIQQQKIPLYGYASQLFDDTAAGRVLVQGSFTINFKEQGYLWAVLRRYFNITAASLGVRSAKSDNQLLKTNRGSSRTMPDILNDKGNRVASNGTRISKASIERMTQGEATRGERFKFYHDLAAYATFDTNSPRDRIFEDIVEAFEDEVWQPNSSNAGLNSQIRRIDANKFDGFDMYIVFGNYSVPGANHSVRKIIGVRLLSESKSIVIDGAPIQESYSFIAQSVA